MAFKYVYGAAIVVILCVIATCYYGKSTVTESLLQNDDKFNTCHNITELRCTVQQLYDTACNDRHLIIGLLHINTAKTLLAILDRYDPSIVSETYKQKINRLHNQVLHRLGKLAPVFQLQPNYEYNVCL